MKAMRMLGVLVLTAGLFLLGCDEKPAASGGPALPPRRAMPPPGFNGPVPSPEAQGVAKALRGATFADDQGLTWRVRSFAVVPNPVSGQGPVVELERNGVAAWLPTPSDGDIAALHRRVHGTAHATVRGDLSAAYRQALAALR